VFDRRVMASLRIQFGRQLRKLRRSRDLTQEQFSEAVGISVDFLSLMERGINAPSFETLERIAAILKVRAYDLFYFRT
jgi:transcriptional regulator with XRE-family HTH domain